jgi:hypothetical protein
MSENTPEAPQDPINPDGADWEEAGLPAQEDSTEETVLPTDREGPETMGGTADVYASEDGRTLDEALAQQERDVPGAGGAAALAEEEPDLVPEDGEGERAAHSAEEQAVHERTESEGA